MVFDIVVIGPNKLEFNLESNFVSRAKLLGYDSLIILYLSESDLSHRLPGYHSSNKYSSNKLNAHAEEGSFFSSFKMNDGVYFGIVQGLTVFVAISCDINSLSRIKQKGFLTAVDCSTNDVSSVSSLKNVDMVFDVESNNRKKYLNIRNSGLNQVVAKNFYDNNILLCEFANHLVFSSSKQYFDYSTSTSRYVCGRGRISVSEYFGRVLQNVILSNKYRFRQGFFSFSQTPSSMLGASELLSLSRIVGKCDSSLKKTYSLTEF
jgi:hypothetical protein